MIRTIDRYVLKEVLLTWFAVTGVLVLVFVSNRFIRYLGDAAAGILPPDTVFALMALKSVKYISLMLPMALYLAILLALGRMYRDSEMAALASCGMSTTSLYRSVMLVALPLTLFTAAATLFLVPRSEAMGDRVEAEARQEAQMTAGRPGRFTETRGGDAVFYLESITADGTRMSNVFAHVEEYQGERVLLSADNAYQEVDPETGDRFLVMLDGYRYDGSPGDMDFRVVEFERHGVLIRQRPPEEPGLSRDAMPLSMLIGSGDRRDIAELQWRVSIPISGFLLAMLAVPLARTTPRQGRYGRLLVGVLVFVIYANLLSVAQVWLEQGRTPAGVGLWWVHLGLAVAVAGLLVWQSGPRWVAARLRGEAAG